LRVSLMTITLILAAFFSTAMVEDEPGPVKGGWSTMKSAPYNRCSYLEVTGPAAAKAQILRQAKRVYREPDPDALAAVEGQVLVRIVTLTERQCTTVPKEVIFVDKKSDKPALRLSLKPQTIALQNGFGATWASTDGIATLPIEEFRAALRDGKFKVVVVDAGGATSEIKGGGIGMPPPWSGDHTLRVR